MKWQAFSHFLIEISSIRSQIYSKGSNHSLWILPHKTKVQEEIHVHASSVLEQNKQDLFWTWGHYPRKKSHHCFLVHASVVLLLLLMIIITIMFKVLYFLRKSCGEPTLQRTHLAVLVKLPLEKVSLICPLYFSVSKILPLFSFSLPQNWGMMQQQHLPADS